MANGGVFALIKYFQGLSVNLYCTCGQVGVFHAWQTPPDFALDPNDELAAQLLCFGKRLGDNHFRIEDNLHKPGSIPEVYENHPAMIPPPMHPAKQLQLGSMCSFRNSPQRWVLSKLMLSLLRSLAASSGQLLLQPAFHVSQNYFLLAAALHVANHRQSLLLFIFTNNNRPELH
jgi:hypothetical protein